MKYIQLFEEFTNTKQEGFAIMRRNAKMFEEDSDPVTFEYGKHSPIAGEKTLDVSPVVNFFGDEKDLKNGKYKGITIEYTIEKEMARFSYQTTGSNGRPVFGGIIPYGWTFKDGKEVDKVMRLFKNAADYVDIDPMRLSKIQEKLESFIEDNKTKSVSINF